MSKDNNKKPAADRLADSTKRFSDGLTDRAPLVGGVVGELLPSLTGTAQIASGVYKGDWGQAKRGLKNVGKSVLSAVTGGAWQPLNRGPKPQHFGGSPEAAAGLASRNAEGVARGLGATGAGIGVIGQAIGMAENDRWGGVHLSNAGIRAAGSGLRGQDQALAASRDAARREVASIAERQMQQGNQQQNAAMLAQAASARGGNQAAAMRMAQAQAAQNNITTNQNTGMMRLAEEQQQRAGEVQANQFAAGQLGDRAKLGYGTAAAGLSAAGAATGRVGSFGTAVGQLGNQSTGQFLDAETDQNKAQLEADVSKAKDDKKAQGGALGVVGKVIGSIFGG